MADTPDQEKVDAARAALDSGQTALGIELGSTRIKAVLIGPDRHAAGRRRPRAGRTSSSTGCGPTPWRRSGPGLQDCYAAAGGRRPGAVRTCELTTVGALGVSAMMHGYLAFDADGELLTPFRTWRNTNTGDAGRAS